MGMRIFQVHVERGRIGSADPFKSSIAAPEFHAALEVRIENPHVCLTPKGPGWSQLIPKLYCYNGWDKSEAREEGECDEKIRFDN
jgi:hypothetical protein